MQLYKHGKQIMSHQFILLMTVVMPLAVSLFACEQQQPLEVPPAHTLTREANGYYCLMTVVNHSGPKGQVLLTDNPQPLWFTSVRDTIAFTRSPEEPKNIAAIYVNDMSTADWDNPGVDNWIDARSAWYVIGSQRAGGMGAPEAVPFATQQQAESFASEQGGASYTFADVPQSFLQQSAP